MTKRRNFSDKLKAAEALEAQLGDKTVQESYNPISSLGRDTVAHATVFLGLLDPSAQDLRNTANLGGSGCDRASLRFA